MALETNYIPLELADLHDKAAELKKAGYRFVQTHAVNTDEDGIELYYSFMKDDVLDNYVVKGVTPEMRVQSISDLFIGSFVFENEARELFGVNMTDIAIDFGGTMYMPAETEPMTFMSPEMKAEKEKAKKIALAKAAKAAKAKKEAEEAAKKAAEGDTVGEGAEAPAAEEKPAKKQYATLEEEIAAKTAGMDPEKAAKVRKALEAKAAREAAQKGSDQ